MSELTEVALVRVATANCPNRSKTLRRGRGRNNSLLAQGAGIRPVQPRQFTRHGCDPYLNERIWPLRPAVYRIWLDRSHPLRHYGSGFLRFGAWR